MFQELRCRLRLSLREALLTTTIVALICGLAAQFYLHRQDLAEQERIIRRERAERRWLFETWVQGLNNKLENFYGTEINGIPVRDKLKVELPDDNPLMSTPSVMTADCTIWVEEDTPPEFFEATIRFLLENLYPSFTNANVRKYTPDLVALYSQVRGKEQVDEEILVGHDDGMRAHFHARPGRSPWLRVRLEAIPDKYPYRFWGTDYPSVPRSNAAEAIER
jgi:hypothetical protein